MLTRKYGGAAEKGIVIKLQSITAPKTSQGALLARGKMLGNIQLMTYRLLRMNVEGNVCLRITRVLEKNCNFAAVRGIFGKHVQTVSYIQKSGVQCVAEKKQKASEINNWPVLFAMMGCLRPYQVLNLYGKNGWQNTKSNLYVKLRSINY